MNKIVITGSSGRIGRALHWKLSQGYDVQGIDYLPAQLLCMGMQIMEKGTLSG